VNHSIRDASKLHAIRTGGVDEIAVGRNPGELFFGGLLILALFIVPPAALVVLAVAGIGDINPIAAGGVLLACLVAGAIATRFYLRNETSSPFRSVRQFMRHAIGQDHARAYLLLVDADKDNTMRQFEGKEYSFANVEDFRDYWNAVREKGGDWGKVKLDPTHQLVFLDRDFAQVKFAFLDMFGRRGATHTKLVVRVDAEWRVFNGEWPSEQERDTGWFESTTKIDPAAHKATDEALTALNAGSATA
jgi:hypothetical protein